MPLKATALATASLAFALAAPAFAQQAPGDLGLGTKLGMTQQNNSGQAGTVTLFARGNSTLVVVRLASAQGKVEAAHIHRGRTQPDQTNSCDNIDPKPAYGLHPVVNGTSVTLVKAPESKLLSGNYVVNVHSQTDPSHYMSCGELYQ